VLAHGLSARAKALQALLEPLDAPERRELIELIKTVALGASDFAAGLASRSAGAAEVTAVAQALGVLTAIVVWENRCWAVVTARLRLARPQLRVGGSPRRSRWAQEQGGEACRDPLLVPVEGVAADADEHVVGVGAGDRPGGVGGVGRVEAGP
jgi:hypothetical protein